ncbi:UPF0182 family protein [Clostridium sp. WLY-B-L2]|uniref:UPF0182 protein LN736_16585 n=1 Tax=Clostridium aromativorans TaxID=2836848 RepID=A0ABS8N9H5_9CLOT|nr:MULTISPECIES: UPF0182 family protein [Clostridium]KAA8664615.1 UPF0182 family protein [Clostridium sp. HV4-5-A1G]MCC9296467.1 UPF0182 family protein [Clostridium aromativorans]CAB1262822.1 conserved membrane hypothetical protein [Clostridiaceae bacterium BL-3]
MKKKKLALGTVILILALCIIFLNNIVNFVINIEWFKEVGYLSVYFTKIIAMFKLIVPLFIISFIGIWLYYKSLRISIIKYRKVVEVNSNKDKFERKIVLIVDLIASFVVSYIFAATYWYRTLQFTNSVPFNIKDPLLNLDVSFYVFRLPLIRSLYNAFLSLVIFLCLITLFTYFLLNIKDRFILRSFKKRPGKIDILNSDITRFAGKQLAVLAALIMIFISVGYVLKCIGLVYSENGVAFGASYTDVHVSLLFYKIIAVASIIAAIVIFISIIKSRFKYIVISIAVIAILVVVKSISYFVVQNFIVKSNQKTLEQPYIKYDIDYTRKAYNIDNMATTSFQVKNDLTSADIKNNMDTIDNIRVNSFDPTLEFYNQVQIIRYYYQFNNIDVDRYYINGKFNQVFIGAREINSKAIDPNTWQNRHLVYTHGYGIVMNKVNSVTSEGQPNFVVKDMPPQNSTDIKLANPRIYFGEKTDDYAVVNTKLDEFDYPKGSDNATNNYNGTAGIKLGIINRILFAINQKDINFLLSRDITKESKILINRNIKDRVNKIAPFLNYESDPYIIMSGGKLYWILDGYTFSNEYPFSQPQNGLNYIRNSVKVVMNAENGNVNFYIMDKNDPIIKSYAKIFPGLFKDVSELSQDIVKHFKYPKDLFNIQCSILGKYHVTNPGVFYSGEDLWEVASNQKEVSGEKSLIESPYVVMRPAGASKEEMILLQYFNMRDKDNMVALFGARMDGDNYGKLILYKFPPEKTIYSPYLFKQKLNQDTTISQQLSLWNKNGSTVQFGDTMIVPIKNSLLYVEPMYLRANGKDSIPEMKRVIVSYGDKILLAQSIDDALNQIFNYNQDSSNESIDNSQKQTTPSVNSDQMKRAKTLYDNAISAQKNGDWAKYGEDIEELGKIIDSLSK